jgi:alpha-2-macroglobulin-like protein
LQYFSGNRNKLLLSFIKIDAYEVPGREEVLYWRMLPGKAKAEEKLSLLAAVPGTYTGPFRCAYLYYTDEHKKWVNGVHVEIAAKQVRLMESGPDTPEEWRHCRR